MENIKSRKDVKQNDKWNLELIYKDVAEFNLDVEKFEQELKKLCKLELGFLDNKENFENCFMQDELVSRILEKLSIYANCKNDEDKTNSIYQELEGKITNLYAKYSEKTAAIIPKILKADQKMIMEYLKNSEKLKPYNYFFKIILARKEHTLDENIEAVLSAYNPVLSASSSISSYLTNADMKFGYIKDEENKEVELTEANYSNYIKSLDRNVRKEAFTKLYEGYEGIKNTLAATYSTTVNNDYITSRLRKYDSSISMYLKPKNIPIKLYDNLIKVVRNNLDCLYDYYKIKQEILGLDQFHLYDTYVKITKDDDKKYSYDEAKKIILEALSVYGEDYVKTLEQAFNNGWIDKYPNKGKKSGAYSTGSYDTIPYVLTNYTDTYNDVSTLAHELGHSMHTYYTNKNNPYITANYPIFLAEIASTTNELLLNHYMFEHSTSKDEKLNLLNEKLDLFKATIFRQTMFAEFEKIAHDQVDAGKVLTCDYLCDVYYKLNQDYFGNDVLVDENIKYEWLRIPHFYTPFYVYQYATSLSISCYVAENIINNTPGFKEKYLKFLESGGRDYPLEVLKIIDIDLTDTKVFENAINYFKNTLDEFRTIYYNN